MDLFILKIGGSSITFKDENKLKAKEDVIGRIAGEIKKAREEDFRLILVHGAGPFGHTNVKEYDIDNGVFTERQKEGLAKTIKDCNFLNTLVVRILNQAGLEAVGMDPNGLIVQEQKKIVEFNMEGVERAIAEGKIPVLYGQMVPDKKLNASVVSGDAIIAFLAKKFNPDGVLLGTDVDGIFTDEPKANPKAELIKRIDNDNFDGILEKVGEARTTDVTGGMRGKLLKLRENLKDTKVVIFNITKEGNVYNLLNGGKGIGTEISF